MQIRIIKFHTIYKQGKDGEMKAVDMVDYTQPGQANFAVQSAPVSRLSKVLPLAGNEENPSVVIANARWDQIEPAYRAWKEGNEIPEEGTPLGAWSGLTQDQAEGLKRSGLRTVEELANASEGILVKMAVPNVLKLKAMASTYLDSKDLTSFSNELADKDAELKAMREEMEELKAMIKKPAPKPAKKGKAA
jgi:hypothetical protein